MKELNWINWVKVLCMMFVYIFHVKDYTHVDDLGFSNIYGAFFTNAFFFASGYLLFAKQLGTAASLQTRNKFIASGGAGYNTLKGVLNKLVLPTILFSTINYFPKKILRGEVIEFGTFAHDTILGGSTWFTAALAVAEIIFVLLLLTRIRNLWFYFFCSVGLTVLAIILSSNDVTVMGSTTIPWYYKGGMACTLILMGGGYLLEVSKTALWAHERLA